MASVSRFAAVALMTLSVGVMAMGCSASAPPPVVVPPSPVTTNSTTSTANTTTTTQPDGTVVKEMDTITRTNGRITRKEAVTTYSYPAP